MVQNMKVIGKMTYNMDMEWKLGLMVHAMKDSIRKERNMERGVMCGATDLDIQEIGLITR